MKKLLVLSAIAALAACGGSDNKPATDPTTTNSTATPATTDTAPAPATTDTAAPASTDTAAPAAPATPPSK